jgi:hypothetical protein
MAGHDGPKGRVGIEGAIFEDFQRSGRFTRIQLGVVGTEFPGRSLHSEIPNLSGSRVER